MASYEKYGMLKKEYLKEHRKGLYQSLILEGRLNEYLNKVDEEIIKQVEMMVEQLAKQQWVTENLTENDSMKWVRMMNSIKCVAEKVILKQRVYNMI